MCFKSSSPPPPPDYSDQINAKQRQMEAANKALAADYNAAAGAFNRSLGQYKTQVGDLGSRIGNLNIASLYDDPATAENENPYSGLKSSLSDLSSNLGAFNMDVERPEFQTFYSGGPWSASVSGTPTLSRANVSGAESLRGNLSSLQNKLDTLYNTRQTEEARLKAFRGDQLGQLTEGQTGADQLTIADLGAINQAERDLSRLKAARGSFASSILDQMYPGGFGQLDQISSDIGSTLGKLRTERAAEERRIGDYGTGLTDFAEQQRARLGDMTIADLNPLTDIQSAIGEKQREAARFSSLLPHNFQGQLSEIGDVGRGAANLLAERQRETDRIAHAERSYIDTARGIEAAAAGGDIYSMAALDTLGDRIRNIRDDLSGFSSVLPYDFSRTTEPLTQAEAAHAALTERRKEAIDELADRVSGANVGLGDLNLYDEQAMRDMISANQAIRGDLSAYTGGRVGGLTEQLGGNISDVDTRLAELSAYRNQLEEQAQALDQRLRESTFYNLDETAGGFDEIAQLEDQIKLYNAGQALDEISAAMDRMNAEKQRLERDAEAVAARDRIAREQLLNAFGPGGVPQFAEFGLTTPMTPEQYIALLQNADDEELEQLSSAASLSPFSQNIGVISV